MMIGNQYKWEEIIASKVEIKRQLGVCLVKSGCGTGCLHKGVLIVEWQSSANKARPMITLYSRFCYVCIHSIYNIVRILALYLVAAECSNIIHLMAS